MFVCDVVIVSHDAVVLEVVPEEKMVLFPRHSIIHQEFIHLRIYPPAVIQIQREESLCVHDLGRFDGLVDSRRESIPKIRFE